MAKKIKPGDLVIDSYRRRGIVTGISERPSDLWICTEKYKNKKICWTKKYDIVWINIIPLSGGAVMDAVPLVRKVRKATKKDFRLAYHNANFFARQSLGMFM